MPMIQLTDHMTLNKKEDQSMTASFLLRRRKITTGVKCKKGSENLRGDAGEKQEGGGLGIRRDRREVQRVRRIN